MAHGPGEMPGRRGAPSGGPPSETGWGYVHKAVPFTSGSAAVAGQGGAVCHPGSQTEAGSWEEGAARSAARSYPLTLRIGMQTFISVDEARALVLQHLPPPRTERVALAEALGRTLAEPVVSREAIPPFASSAMDGFAVKAADLASVPVSLPVVAEIPAGQVADAPLQAGQCMRIMTGAPVPEGADAVVPVEWTEEPANGSVTIRRAPDAGQNVRPAGQDVAEGEAIVAQGAVVTPPVVGMLATLGYATVRVAVPPRVAVVSTGDELIDPDEELSPGRIRDSNAPALAAQVEASGGVPVYVLRARDTKASIRAVLDEAQDADVLVLSGGVSVGDYDLVKQVLDERGLELLFWKVRQRPGKPLAFGLLGDTPVFGLPGNPVSSAMCFEQYVRPALATMLGRAEVLRPLHPATLAGPVRKVPALRYFTRGIARVEDDGRIVAGTTGPQGSNLYSSVVRANCIIHLPEGLEDPPAGTPISIEWLAW